MIDKLKLAWKGRRAMAEVKTAEKQGFDMKLMLWKGLKTFTLAVMMQFAPLVIAALSDEQLIGATLREAGAPVGVVVAVTALIVAGGKMASNWWHHRNVPR